MADLTYQNKPLTTYRGAQWGAIWAGVFTFLAIWAVFGVLGMAIFAAPANAQAAAVPFQGMTVGMGFWSVILTVVAMYFGGRETSRLAALHDRESAVMHGMAMFGVTVATVFALVVLGGMATAGGAATGGAVPYLFALFADSGWIGFISLLFGWLAAMLGASKGIEKLQYAAPQTASHQPEEKAAYRPAA